jgi:acyl-CoA synthetase (AMP-forming)/AMP-acid ligase II
MQRAFPFTAGDVVCFHTAPSFVDSIWQVFGPLLGGVPLLVLPPSALHDMGALFKALQQHAVTHFIAVPTVLAALMRHMEFSGQEGATLVNPPTLSPVNYFVVVQSCLHYIFAAIDMLEGMGTATSTLHMLASMPVALTCLAASVQQEHA